MSWSLPLRGSSQASSGISVAGRWSPHPDQDSRSVFFNLQPSEDESPADGAAPVACTTRVGVRRWTAARPTRSEEHTSELQSLMRISYAVFCLKKKKSQPPNHQPLT